MLTVYGRMMPLRILEEIRFWKMQEKEHTVVIRELIPSLEKPYVQLLQEWEEVFAGMEYTAQQWIDACMQKKQHALPAEKLHEFIRASMEQSREFIRHLHQLMKQSKAVRKNAVAPIVLLHIIRESEYFLGVLTAYMATREQKKAAGAEQQNSPTWSEFTYSGGVGTQNMRTGPSAEIAQIEDESGQKADTDDEEFTTHPYAVGHPYEPNDQYEMNPQNAQMSTYREDAQSDKEREMWSNPLSGHAQEGPVPIGGHRLPPLPYPYDALEPYIDEETMRLHHDIHHKGYVEGLNKAERKLAEARKKNDFELIKHWERELAFHGAGHYLHTIFWNIMKPDGGGKPTGAIAAQINRDFGSFAAFKAQFSKAAEEVEGGGWAILVWSPRSHRLEILQAEKHQNLSQWDVIPLLVLDVWEHAYYLKYQNKRADYVKNWWNTVNWDHVNERFAKARRLEWTPY